MPTSSRPAARVVMLAPDLSVLLLSGRDPSGAGVGPFWLVPGGGVNPGETPEEAARREAYEEVGVVLGDLGLPVWRRHAAFDFDGRHYDQSEVFFVVRTPLFASVPTALTELERRFTTGARWWPLDELAASSETVFPTGLARLIAAWISNGPPTAPEWID
ncbi:MAG: NUDIX hydrolase [Acidimicrobiales bacterium]